MVESDSQADEKLTRRRYPISTDDNVLPAGVLQLEGKSECTSRFDRAEFLWENRAHSASWANVFPSSSRKKRALNHFSFFFSRG